MTKYSLKTAWSRIGEERCYKGLFDHLKNSTLVVALAAAAANVFTTHLDKIESMGGVWTAFAVAIVMVVVFFSLLWYNAWFYIKQIAFPQLTVTPPLPRNRKTPTSKVHIRLKLDGRLPSRTSMAALVSRHSTQLVVSFLIAALWGPEVYAFFSAIGHLGESQRPAIAAEMHRPVDEMRSPRLPQREPRSRRNLELKGFPLFKVGTQRAPTQAVERF